ncbi:MAG TPA: BadF/BadG/BcrA/BcrD ATPase family protein [Vicinamibacterales bacterium]|nr:BadF/BadG/BcrA/BcrD ATPase family protein [Vicinamibacterales bacterium]
MSRLEVFVGIDLGSTTTKAVVLNGAGEVIGRGITNSRSNYDVACAIARQEAFVATRFNLTQAALAAEPELALRAGRLLPALSRSFRLQQHLDQLERLRHALARAAGHGRDRARGEDVQTRIDGIVDAMRTRAAAHFGGLSTRKSDFFRDLAAADYMHLAEQQADPDGVTFDVLASLFDAAILPVENSSSEALFETHIDAALERVLQKGVEDSSAAGRIREIVRGVSRIELTEASTVGTGYGRQRLPFPKEQIRSEILCHGLGAHVMFPATRTVLDIGGQDTKAIQVDAEGIVTSFQMNDRCAAGCGRYLGYIADEMNLGLHELGPLAQQSRCHVKINSTCTVFAGAELRERLSLGQRREDILAGLHRAIILRAMSLLARSGGVSDEFTFTGGVARNPAAVAALSALVRENYGDRQLNISADSIYTGALGAALFALRAGQQVSTC